MSLKRSITGAIPSGNAADTILTIQSNGLCVDRLARNAPDASGAPAVPPRARPTSRTLRQPREGARQGEQARGKRHDRSAGLRHDGLCRARAARAGAKAQERDDLEQEVADETEWRGKEGGAGVHGRGSVKDASHIGLLSDDVKKITMARRVILGEVIQGAGTGLVPGRSASFNDRTAGQGYSLFLEFVGKALLNRGVLADKHVLP